MSDGVKGFNQSNQARIKKIRKKIIFIVIRKINHQNVIIQETHQ